MTLLHSSKNIFLLAGTVALLALTGCKNENTQKNTPATQTENTVETTSGNSGDVALNPAHGQPGHRCDIPVGAPLNSAAKADNNNTTRSQQGSTEQSPILKTNNNNEVKLQPGTTGNTASGNLNPAHGQPGHRCDIPVGAPLD